MADPIGIVGVLSTADVVFTRLFKYIKAVRSAEREILDLAAEVKHLCWTLQSVKTAADDLKDLNGRAPLVDGKHISDCIATLDELREILSKYQGEAETDSAVRVVRNRWKWPVEKSKVQDLKRKIHDHNVAFATTLSANGMSMMLEMLGNTQSSATTLEKVSKLLEASAQIELDKETREILSTVGSVRPLGHQKTNAQLHHPGTGIWFLESDELKSWLTTQNSKLWVFGIPGAGKSVLASAAVEKALATSDSNHAVAYFYCDYKDSETQNPVNILGSLAEQIARQDARSFDKVKAFVYAHTRNRDLHTFSADEEELCKLLIRMAENFEATTIIVDGLDECEDVRRTTSCLASLGEGSARIRTFLSSRKIPDVEDFMSDYEKISIAAKSSDIRLYVAAEIEKRMKPNNVRRLRMKDPHLKGEIMDRLINGAEGMFRWAAVQLDSFCEMPSDFDIREALKILPRGLFPSYERVLDRINRKHPLTQRLVQCALKWITHHIMKVEALLEALAIREDTHQLKALRKCDVEDILLHCESLVRLSSDGDFVELAHFTVKEYLISIDGLARPDLLRYRMDFQIDREYLATPALIYLTCEEFNPICSNTEEWKARYDDHPFRVEAVRNWPVLARDCTDCPGVQMALERLFDSSHGQYIAAWAQEFFILCPDNGGDFDSLNDNAESLVELNLDWEAFSPLHWAAMLRLPGVCQSLACLPHQDQSGSPFGTPLHMALIGDRLRFGLTADAISGRINACQMFAFYGDNGEGDGSTVETLKVLIRHGADVNGRWPALNGMQKLTTLAIAIECDDLDSFDYLLDAGSKCGLDAIEKLSESLDGIGDLNEKGYQRWCNFVDCISEEKLSHGTHEAFWKMKARICTLSQGEELTSQAMKSIIDTVNRKPQPELLLDSARFNNEKMMELLLRDKSTDCNSRNEAGESVLSLAAEYSRVSMVQMLLDCGAQLELPDKEGKTPLHKTIEGGTFEVVELLLKRGADPRATDLRGWSVWHFVASRKADNGAQIFSLISKYGPVDANAADESGITPWLGALKAQNTECFLLFEKAGADTWSKDSSGRTAMHIAARNDDIKQIKRLLSLGHDPASYDHAGLNVLSYCLANVGIGGYCSLHLYQYNLDLLFSKPPGGGSALDLLCQHRDWASWRLDDARKAVAGLCQVANNARKVFLGIIAYITESISSDHHGPYEVLKSIFDQHPALLTGLGDDSTVERASHCLSRCLSRILASGSTRTSLEADQLTRLSTILIDHMPEGCLRKLRVEGHLILNVGLITTDPIAHAVLKRFLDIDSRDLENNDRKRCYNALECAFAYDCGDKVFSMIVESTASFESKTPSGDSLLHLAAPGSFEDRIRLLLSKGLNPNEKGEGNNSPLHLACSAEREESAMILLEAGADPWLPNSKGVPPAQLAVQNGLSTFLSIVSTRGDAWTYAWPVDTWKGVLNSVLALKLHHLAAYWDQLDCLKYLLSLPQYFKLDDLTENGETLLSIAVDERCYPVVNFLLQSGAKIHIDRNGNTALHKAAEYGDLDIVKALLEHGFDALQPGLYSRTPLSIAMSRGEEKVVSAMKASITHRVLRDDSASVPGIKDAKPASTSDSRQRELEYAIDSDDLDLCRRLACETHIEVQPCSCCGSVNALLHSLWRGKEDIALYLINMGPRPDELLHGTWNALHICAYSNLHRALERLLDKWPMLLFLRTTVHPLHLAVLKKNENCLRIMLEQSMSCWTKLSNMKYVSLNHPDLDSALDDVQISGSLQFKRLARHQLIPLEELINVEISYPLPDDSVGAEYAFLQSKGVSTALQCAAYGANAKATRLLLQYGARVDQECSWSLSTALSIAVRQKAPAVIAMLLDHGASVNHFDILGNSCGDMVKIYLDDEETDQRLLSRDLGQEPPSLDPWFLVSALAKTSRVLDLAQVLKRSQELTTPDMSGESAIQICLYSGSAVTQTYLLNSGFDLSGSTTSFGGALTCGWHDTQLGLLKRILRRLGNSKSCKLLNFKPRYRDTPLYTAAAQGRLGVLRLFLLNGAEIDLVGGQLGTPVIAAASYGRLNVVKELINGGAAVSCFCPALEETANVFDQARSFPAIQRWLLVGRWMEKKCIGWVEHAAGSGDRCGGDTSSREAGGMLR